MEQQCRNEEGRSLSLRARSDTAAAAQKREEILHDNGKTMFEQIGLSVLCRSVLGSGILDLAPGMAGTSFVLFWREQGFVPRLVGALKLVKRCKFTERRV